MLYSIVYMIHDDLRRIYGLEGNKCNMSHTANQLQPGDMLIIREGDMHLCAAAIRLYGRTYLPHLPGIREEISGKALADRYYITYTPGAFIASKTQAFVIGTDHALWRNAHTTYSAATFEGRAHKSQIC